MDWNRIIEILAAWPENDMFLWQISPEWRFLNHPTITAVVIMNPSHEGFMMTDSSRSEPACSPGRHLGLPLKTLPYFLRCHSGGSRNPEENPVSLRGDMSDEAIPTCEVQESKEIASSFPGRTRNDRK